jgi:hypothetical protein
MERKKIQKKTPFELEGSWVSLQEGNFPSRRYAQQTKLLFWKGYKYNKYHRDVNNGMRAKLRDVPKEPVPGKVGGGAPQQCVREWYFKSFQTGTVQCPELSLYMDDNWNVQNYVLEHYKLM